MNIQKSNAQIAVDEYQARPPRPTVDQIELEIRQERTAQDLKFGRQDHQPFKWLAILGEEVGEVNKAVIDAYSFEHDLFDNVKLQHYRLELIQVAAVAKAMIEAIDRNTWGQN